MFSGICYINLLCITSCVITYPTICRHYKSKIIRENYSTWLQGSTLWVNTPVILPSAWCKDFYLMPSILCGNWQRYWCVDAWGILDCRVVPWEWGTLSQWGCNWCVQNCCSVDQSLVPEFMGVGGNVGPWIPWLFLDGLLNPTVWFMLVARLWDFSTWCHAISWCKLSWKCIVMCFNVFNTVG